MDINIYSDGKIDTDAYTLNMESSLQKDNLNIYESSEQEQSSYQSKDRLLQRSAHTISSLLKRKPQLQKQSQDINIYHDPQLQPQSHTSFHAVIQQHINSLQKQ